MMTSKYTQLARKFGEVRRSWKRAAALSGLAVVASESIGLFTAFLFLDWLYQPGLILRVSAWIVVIGVIGSLLARHVAAPLLRKIPDEQIALYIEEHCRELDGVLITAAEFGSQSNQSERKEAALIQAVVAEAVKRAQMPVRHLIDLSRLKKYSFVVLGGIVMYLVLGIAFPRSVGQHVGRVIAPWKPRAEDTNRRSGFFEPLRFSFSKADSRLVRGATFSFEVTLSRTAENPVVLNFRPATPNAHWQTLPMKEIEKLNGFQGTIADVSEDLEFQVICGGSKSEVHRLTVFDPLVVQSIEVTTHYPEYTKLSDRVENPSSGNIEAVIGSIVKVRVFTSTPIKAGVVNWSEFPPVALVVDPKNPTAAEFTFTVAKDATYTYQVSDIYGQEITSVAPLSVHAIPDAPPTLKVNAPKSPLLTNPLGEVVVDADAGDDFGVSSVDLVYTRLNSKRESTETRIPLTLTPSETQTSVHAIGRLAFEEAQPPLQPEEALSFHLEARDSKGQKTVSEIGLIVVGYFESWSTWDKDPPTLPDEHRDEGPDLVAMLKAVWLLESEKARLSPDELRAQSKQVADLMTEKSSGTLRDFVNLPHYPQLKKVAPEIILHANNGYKALLASDTGKASAELATAAAIAAGGKLLEDLPVMHMDASGNSGTLNANPAKEAIFTKADSEALNAAAPDKAHTEKEQAAAKNAADIARSIDALIAKQDEVLANSKNATVPAAMGSLAGSQKQLAENTRQLADQASKGGAAPGQTTEKISRAAKAMYEAAAEFSAGHKEEAEAKSKFAKSQLQQARENVSANSREKLAEAISQAESRASALLDEQRGIRKATETVATAIGNNAEPSQAQRRDLQELTLRQATLHGKAQALEKEIADLASRTEAGGQKEALGALTNALQTVKRNRPEAKMANAVADLGQMLAAPAVKEQQKAEDALGKISANLRSGEDALSASRQASLARAVRNTNAAQRAVAQLADAAKSGKELGNRVENNPAREGAAQAAAHQLQLVASGLDHRDLAAQADVDRVKEISKDKEELEKSLLSDPKLVSDVSGLLARISATLEREVQAKTEASALFASQREECPPGYRPFVNQYFEALSQPKPGEQPQKP